jgi:hypothetical protein
VVAEKATTGFILWMVLGQVNALKNNIFSDAPNK